MNPIYKLYTTKIFATDLKATIDGIEYTWGGGLGSVVESYECGIKENDVRMIGKTIFYAGTVQYLHYYSWKKRINWVTQQENDVEWLREFKNEIFGLKL